MEFQGGSPVVIRTGPFNLLYFSLSKRYHSGPRAGLPATLELKKCVVSYYSSKPLYKISKGKKLSGTVKLELSDRGTLTVRILRGTYSTTECANSLSHIGVLLARGW